MCDAVLVVPGGLTLPVLRGKVRRYFDERYNVIVAPDGRLIDCRYRVQVFIPSKTRCYAKVQKVLPMDRNASTLRVIERTLEYDISIGATSEISEGPA